MSSFSKYLKSKKVLLILIFILLSGGLVISLHLYKPTFSFQEFTNQLFLDDITTDTLSLHYTLAYPSHYSLDSYTLTLPKYEKDDLQKSRSKIENSLFVLNTINPLQLNKEEAYCHDLLTSFFSMQINGFPFTYFEECFSPSSGIITNYPVVMAEYTFRSKKDVTDYLTLLADTNNYFSSFFEFQKERAQKGYCLSSVSLQEIIKQCDTIITGEALENNSHFLQHSFRERLAPLVAKDILSKKEAFSFIEKNNSLLKEVVLPSYQKLKESFLSLQTKEIPLCGLYRYAQGQNYYTWYVQKQIGCSLSIPEILEKLENDYEINLLSFRTLQEKISAYPDYEKYIGKGFPMTDRNRMLSVLQTLSKKDFPSLLDTSGKTVTTTIKSVSSYMEEYTSPAFYMIPPIDDFWKNTIYINDSSTPEGLDLFTTLAHEGYPGHLNQTVYYQLYSQKENTPLIRHILNYGGYVEGWAIYCEFYSYDYATMLYSDDAKEFYTLWHQLLACDKKLQLAVLSILDIQLHYYNDSLETAANILSQYGITDQKTISEIHQYILEEPGNYLKYYMGYLLLMDLKEKAENLMGSDFTDYKFHEFILNAGPSDFDNLERRLLDTVSS